MRGPPTPPSKITRRMTTTTIPSGLLMAAGRAPREARRRAFQARSSGSQGSRRALAGKGPAAGLRSPRGRRRANRPRDIAAGPSARRRRHPRAWARARGSVWALVVSPLLPPRRGFDRPHLRRLRFGDGDRPQALGFGIIRVRAGAVAQVDNFCERLFELPYGFIAARIETQSDRALAERLLLVHQASSQSAASKSVWLHSHGTRSPCAVDMNT